MEANHTRAGSPPAATLTRRSVLQGSLAAAATMLVWPRSGRANAAVSIGVTAREDYAMSGPILLASVKGFFDSQALSAALIQFPDGPSLAQAMKAGDILLGVSSGPDLLVAREAGAGLTMIATQVESNPLTLHAIPEIERVADLRGRRIGVSQADLGTRAAARILAKAQSWNPDRDITLVVLPDLGAQLAALGRKEIEAVIWGDGSAVGESRGVSRLLMRLGSLTPKWIGQVQYSSDETIRRDSATIRRALLAIFQAIRFMKAHPAESATLIAAELGWSLEAARSAQAISTRFLSWDGRISVEALASMQDTLLDLGFLRSRLPQDTHFTRKFVPVKV